MSVRVEIVGTDRVVARLTSMANGARKHKNVYRQAQKTMTKAVKYTPLLTGALRRSGKVEINGDQVEISFGGAEAPYAVYVHEILHYVHPVGQAKFLERAVQEDAKKFADALAKDMMSP
jgi:hypothetical protein